MRIAQIPKNKRAKWLKLLNACIKKWKRIVKGGEWEDCPACSYVTSHGFFCEACPLVGRNGECCGGLWDAWERNPTDANAQKVLLFIQNRRDSLARLIELNRRVSEVKDE